FKNTPSRVFVTVGASYRLDFHNDKLKAIDDQNANENGGAIKKNSMKKKNRKERKSSRGAEDIDLGPSKKQLRKLKKQENKKGNNNNGSIDF
ncbi:MAG: transporter, partial [Pricia sp.]|nr:transporter [Pricia sp.]